MKSWWRNLGGEKPLLVFIFIIQYTLGMNMVYVTNIKELSDEKVFQEQYERVSEYRRKKVDKMKFPNDKRRSLAAGLLLQKALGELGIDEKTIVFETNQNGKPFIKCENQNSGLKAVHFNLSHSGDYAMCVIGDNPVGCDVERVRKIDLKLADRFFAPLEIELIRSQPSNESQINTFFRLWTLKESYIKALGKGLSLGLDSFSIQLSPLQLLSNKDDENITCNFYEYNADNSYKFSACILGSGKLSKNVKILTLL